ncbi:MAG: hypothetical protein NPMRTH4_360003 [Nitrosopumilales archaeon]|nr:MAG: hypothetical protein NPMRTH4_360003 [Nitrosopumilales archaeon]
MNQDKVLQMTEQIMKKDHDFLDSLASEKPVHMKRHKEEDIIDEVLKLIPKSTEGKILAAGAIGLIAYFLLKSKNK